MASYTFTVFKGSEGNIIQSETTRPALTGNQVLVAVTASGLCGGDLIFRGNDASILVFQAATYNINANPRLQMVLGHEGVGVVAATGPDATILKKGDRVGWGFLQDVCGNCQQCTEKTDNFCPERKMYGYADLDQGSLAYGIVKKETRLFAIPTELSDEEAAPLMCAGATVFNVFDTYGIKSTDRVGVVGLGGLGHLAIPVRIREDSF
jgi:D-arabinose 1-dehydrogenase-like Zn-dependent alcohol dehydrogenase